MQIDKDKLGMYFQSFMKKETILTAGQFTHLLHNVHAVAYKKMILEIQDLLCLIHFE